MKNVNQVINEKVNKFLYPEELIVLSTIQLFMGNSKYFKPEYLDQDVLLCTVVAFTSYLYFT